MMIHSRLKDYSVEMVDDFFLLQEKFQNQKFYFLIDENILALYRNQLENFMDSVMVIPTPGGENSKTLSQIATLYEKLFKKGFQRNNILVVMGGGSVLDLCGFVASTIYRGVRWISVPTTLLAQVDSCIGGKTSLNFLEWKNQIGTFYPPQQVVIDPHFLKTLPEREIKNGLAEIVKMYLMDKESSFKDLSHRLTSQPLSDFSWRDIILEALRIKRSYIEEDEFDVGKRNLLNFGHCFGHALESASGFSISHGEAVYVGILFANFVSLNRCYLSERLYRDIEKVIRPNFTKINFQKFLFSDLVSGMKQDKKRHGTDLSMILLHKVGELKCYHDLTIEELQKIYEEFKMSQQ